jgi:excisionase family DNA binding protein
MFFAALKIQQMKNSNQTLLVIDPEQLANIVNESIRNFFDNNPQGQPQNDLLTITEAAKFLNCSIPTIYAKTSKRAIPFHKQGKRVYFSRRELEQWVKEG